MSLYWILGAFAMIQVMVQGAGATSQQSIVSSKHEKHAVHHGKAKASVPIPLLDLAQAHRDFLTAKQKAYQVQSEIQKARLAVIQAAVHKANIAERAVMNMDQSIVTAKKNLQIAKQQAALAKQEVKKIRKQQPKTLMQQAEKKMKSAKTLMETAAEKSNAMRAEYIAAQKKLQEAKTKFHETHGKMIQTRRVLVHLRNETKSLKQGISYLHKETEKAHASLEKVLDANQQAKNEVKRLKTNTEKVLQANERAKAEAKRLKAKTVQAQAALMEAKRAKAAFQHATANLNETKSALNALKLDVIQAGEKLNDTKTEYSEAVAALEALRNQARSLQAKVTNIQSYNGTCSPLAKRSSCIVCGMVTEDLMDENVDQIDCRRGTKTICSDLYGPNDTLFSSCHVIVHYHCAILEEQLPAMPSASYVCHLMGYC